MSEPIIRVDNLGKRYRIGLRERPAETFRDSVGSFLGGPFQYLRQMSRPPTEDETLWALKNVSFQVEAGEVVGIIGRNGAGKSTLLKILSRITDPTEGRAVLHGRVGSLLEVATGFHPDLTGRENVYLSGAILGMKKWEIDGKFDEIIEFAGIDRFIDTPVKRYSSGMYVRLGFAVAAHLEPEILIVDEVLAVGDHEFQLKSLGKMKEVGKAGRTVLFVSHNMASISNLCSRVLWLAHGEIRLMGDSQELVGKYITSTAPERGIVNWSHLDRAPGSDVVKLRSIRIRSNGVVTSDVLIDQPISVEIEYWNLREGAVLDATIHVRDKMNSFVFASANRPSSSLGNDEWAAKKRPAGLYRSTCIIPANFLNADYYSIDAGISNQRFRWEVNVENAISFLVHETGAMGKEYKGKWVGVIRPKLEWSTKWINNE